MPSKNSLNTDQDERTGGASIRKIPILVLGGDSWKIRDNVYEIIPEIHKALSSTGYTGDTMKNEKDILMMINISRDGNYTGRADRDSKRKTFYTKELPKKVR